MYKTRTCLPLIALLVCAGGPLATGAAAQSGEATRGADPRRAARESAARERPAEHRPSLIDRPDRKRPTSQITFSLFGRPLTFGGRYSFKTKYEATKLLDFNFLRLDTSDIDGDGDFFEPQDAAEGLAPFDDQLRFNQSLQFDVFYPITEKISLFLGGRLSLRNLVSAGELSQDHDWNLSHSESWIYLADLFGSPLSLQVGRQRFTDDRQWWWDQNLDAIRLRFDLESVHAEVSVAQELFPVSTSADFIDPENKDLLIVLGSLDWEWAKRSRVGLHLLHQRDSSSALPVGNCVRPLPPNVPPSPFFTSGCIEKNRDDESDADLTSFGASASGRVKLRGWGLLYYWANAAGVVGEETFYDIQGPRRQRRVRSVTTHDVRGWGGDLTMTWQTRLPLRPRLTLGYAFGSGDRGALDQSDGSFRQTGVHDNSAKFLGVDSFNYYGELFDPEISNLHITTAAIGFPLLRKSSIELIYHYYRQVHQARFFRDVSFKQDPDGLHRGIGQEWDVVIGLEDWGNLEIEVVGAAFRTGKAFKPDSHRMSYLGELQVRYNF